MADYAPSLQTVGSAWTQLAAFEVPADSVCSLDMVVHASDHGSNAGAWVVTGPVRRPSSGDPVPFGVDILDGQKTVGAAAWDVRLVATGGGAEVVIQVRGGLEQTVDWGITGPGYVCMVGGV